MEDIAYYMRRAEEQQFDLDLGEVKQYFPFDLVLTGIFRILQDLFGNTGFWTYLCKIIVIYINRLALL